MPGSIFRKPKGVHSADDEIKVNTANAALDEKRTQANWIRNRHDSMRANSRAKAAQRKAYHRQLRDMARNRSFGRGPDGGGYGGNGGIGRYGSDGQYSNAGPSGAGGYSGGNYANQTFAARGGGGRRRRSSGGGKGQSGSRRNPYL